MGKLLSGKGLLVVGLLSLVFLYFLHPIPLQGPNVDLGHHLLLGKLTVEKGYVPQTNLISFTHPEYIFVNNQWLSEVVFYIVHKTFGFNGLIFLAGLLVTTSFGFLSASVRKQIVAGCLVGFVLLQLFLDRTEVKPELFSYLFLSIYLYILFRNRSKSTNLVFLLPLLATLWINFHIFFIVGLTVIGLFLLEKYQDKRLWIVFIFSILASLINPNGIKAIIYPFHVLTNYGFDVIENYHLLKAVSMGYANFTFLVFGLVTLFICASLLFVWTKTEKIHIYLLSLFLFLSFFAVRHFPLLAVGAFISVVHLTNLLLQNYKKQITRFNGIVMVILVVCFITITGTLIRLQLYGLGLGVNDEANQAVVFLQKNNIKGPIFNNYNIGNYLEYRLYPTEKIFVDGNPEQYPAEFFRKVYYPMENSFEEFEKQEKKYKIETVFYEHRNQTKNTNPLLFGLAHSDNWKMVYLDPRIVIYTKYSSKIRAINEKSFKLYGNILTKEKIGDLSNFFRVVGWYNSMLEMDLKYLEYEPKNCLTLQHITAVMSKNNTPLLPIYFSQFQNYCQK